MDAAERELLKTAVRDALEGATERGTASVDPALSELGWLDMLADEPTEAIAIVFGALGATNVAAGALDDVVVAALGGAPRPDLCSALPPFASSDPPGTRDGPQVSAVGLATPRVAEAAEMLVVCRDGSGLVAVTTPITAVDATAVQGVDPAAGLHRVRVDGDLATATPLDELAWEAALAHGRRATAHQMAGACRAMLELARAHALERVQFGRPVARFQAVRHRLAETLVAIEALDAVLVAAADEPGPLTAALAKAAAGRTARTVATHCQQVLAGVGFTTEHSFHRFLKRTMLLEGVFGSADRLVRDIGQRLLASRRVPTLVEL